MKKLSFCWKISAEIIDSVVPTDSRIKLITDPTIPQGSGSFPYMGHRCGQLHQILCCKITQFDQLETVQDRKASIRLL